MKFNAFALAVITAVASVHAQSTTTTTTAALPTSTADVPSCILSCTTPAATAAGCNGVTDLACVCTNTSFQKQALACLQQSCSAADLQTANALQAEECSSFTS